MNDLFIILEQVKKKIALSDNEKFNYMKMSRNINDIDFFIGYASKKLIDKGMYNAEWYSNKNCEKLMNLIKIDAYETSMFNVNTFENMVGGLFILKIIFSKMKLIKETNVQFNATRYKIKSYESNKFKITILIEMAGTIDNADLLLITKK